MNVTALISLSAENAHDALSPTQIRLGNLKAEAEKTKSKIEEDSAVCIKQILADVDLQVRETARFPSEKTSENL